MTAKDQLKIIKKGFRIIRMDLSKMRIKYKDSKNQEWKFYDTTYKNKAAMERDFNTILKNDPEWTVAD